MSKAIAFGDDVLGATSHGKLNVYELSAIKRGTLLIERERDTVYVENIQLYMHQTNRDTGTDEIPTYCRWALLQMKATDTDSTESTDFDKMNVNLFFDAKTGNYKNFAGPNDDVRTLSAMDRAYSTINRADYDVIDEGLHHLSPNHSSSAPMFHSGEYGCLIEYQVDMPVNREIHFNTGAETSCQMPLIFIWWHERWDADKLTSANGTTANMRTAVKLVVNYTDVV